MIILVLGKNYSAEKFCKLFEFSKENIVFSINQKYKNYINLKNAQDILDFCLANKINLVLITEEEYVDCGIQELLSANNITVFAPSIDAIDICASKAYAKKFMYKNKIPTSSFIVADKPQIAYDYIKENNFPIVIRPDNHSYIETSLFAETPKNAICLIDKYFSNDNQRIVIEKYVEGINVKFWALTNGYSAKILFKCAQYQNNVALFEPSFIKDELIEKIYENSIMPTITSLNEDNNEYIGILGFDYIIDKNYQYHLTGYNSFFDDISVDFLNLFDIKWENVFESTVIGDVFIKYEFKKLQKYAITYRKKDGIGFLCANTKANLNRYIDMLEDDNTDIEEAKELWKYWQ